MKNIDKLIALYFYICRCYDTELTFHSQRMSNNYAPKFRDEEVITIFLYCIIVEKKRAIKDIYDFADNYLRSWFPDLVDTTTKTTVGLTKTSVVCDYCCRHAPNLAKLKE